MDPVSAVYYAVICAALGYAAGNLRPAGVRVLAGVLVGLAAAAFLPVFRGFLGL